MSHYTPIPKRGTPPGTVIARSSMLNQTGKITLLALAVLCSVVVAAGEPPRQGPSFEDDRLLVKLTPRTPEQMAAFYEARGFPRAALERIRRTCFITVHIRNKGKDILWLDLDDWRFSSAGNPLQRLGKAYWQAQWDAIGLGNASRSTFGWTQLPPVRDLRHDESVGGNLAFPVDSRALDIDAIFHSGADRQGEVVRLSFGQVPCNGDSGKP